MKQITLAQLLNNTCDPRLRYNGMELESLRLFCSDGSWKAASQIFWIWCFYSNFARSVRSALIFSCVVIILPSSQRLRFRDCWSSLATGLLTCKPILSREGTSVNAVVLVVDVLPLCWGTLRADYVESCNKWLTLETAVSTLSPAITKNWCYILLVWKYRSTTLGWSLAGYAWSNAYAPAWVAGLWPVWKERSCNDLLKSFAMLGLKGWMMPGRCFLLIATAIWR
jgi:hypothetical protein